MKSMMRSCLVVSAILTGLEPAFAVIISGGDGSGNITGTGAGSGWNYSGIVNTSFSGVYLGNGWVLTADHITGPGFASSFKLGGTTYLWDGTTPRVQLHDPSNPSIPVDLQMFRVSNGPSLTWLTIGSSTPAANTSITMIGNGRDRSLTPSYYGSNWSTVPQVNAVYTGYTETSTQHERWGTNSTVGFNPSGLPFSTEVVAYTLLTPTTYTQCFFALFDSNAGANEAMLAYGDSGGGVFGTSGNLLGISLYYWKPLNSTGTQPNNTAVYGDMPGYADLSLYRSQIIGLVPEPSTALVFLLIPLLAARRRS